MKLKYRHAASVFFRLAALFLCWGSITFSAHAQGLDVETHTQEEIRTFLKNSGADMNDKPVFSKNPVVTAPYNPGKLSEATQKSALGILNWVRYIAGIDADVVLDELCCQQAQAGALLNAVNLIPTHFPTRPSGMDDSLYRLGYIGASSSNIAWNSVSSYPLGLTIVHGWMNDGDESNIATTGHRRWLLSPQMTQTGFGEVVSPIGAGSFMTVRVGVFGRTSSYRNVAWPAQNMPVECFGTTFPWTVTTGAEDGEDYSSIHVKLARRSDKKTWNFSGSSSNGSFYVSGDCIIFRPDDITSYKAGDIYDVTVTGTSVGTLSYTVNFFSLDKSNESDSPTAAAKGTQITDSSTGSKYKVTKSGTSPTVAFTKPGSKKKTVTIPATIKKNGITYKVTSVAANALKGNTAVTTVKIGKNVTSIGSKAFYGCTKLKTLTMGANVKTISDQAFYKCTALKSITIPSKVTKIGKKTFYGCKNLKTLTIKSTKLTSQKVGSNAFKGTYSKASVKVPKGKTKAYKKLLQSKGLSKKAKIK